MIEDAEYHQRREAQERAIAASLPEGEARERHLALADRHADRAWLLRDDQCEYLAGWSTVKPAPRAAADHGLSQAIGRSRELLARSRRLLAESRENVVPGL